MGTTANNSIEINGKLYDARTGRLVESHSPEVSSAKPKLPAAAKHSGRSIDGMTRAASKQLAVAKKPRNAAPHAPAHKVQRPQTLMRRSVLKPQKESRSSMLKVQVPVARHPQTSAAVQPKLSVSQVHPARAHAAAHTPKSPAVTKYSKPLDFTKPSQQQLHKPTIKAIQTETSVEKTQNPHTVYFQKAIEQASNHATVDKSSKTRNHKLQKSFKRHRSVFAVAASITLVVAIGGFVAFANMSKIELKVANMRAGVQASLPAYEPAGYAKDGPVSYQAGKVTITFKNTASGNQAYQVSQQESDLNSSTLQDEVLAGGTKPRQVVQQNGNTIYLFGDSDAAWVSGGILYKITGDANLSTNEILLIADSV